MFRLCKAILPHMKVSGSVINTGSIQSFDPSPSLIAYASTKAAIVSFTDQPQQDSSRSAKN
jgi:short-subunit dehydrogenase